MMKLQSRAALVLSSLCLLLAGAPARATSYVMVADEVLVEQADLVAEVEFGDALPAEVGTATEYQAVVIQPLKGNAHRGTLTVRVPGGMRPDGSQLRIWGAPSFEPGERALLFLQRNEDGSYSVAHLMLGAFHAVDAGGRRYAVRDLRETTEAQMTSKGLVLVPASDEVRDLDLWSEWIAERVAGGSPEADYFVPMDSAHLDTIRPMFTLFEGGDGVALRWFRFDGAKPKPVQWRGHAVGQRGLKGGGYAELKAALKTWTADPATPILYNYTGTTRSIGGLETPDGVNSVVFNDPTNIIPAFDCSSGGILAVGGPWFTASTRQFRGQSFHEIGEADVVINDNLGCFFRAVAAPARAAQELFAHELGHTLGLGHSCGDSSSPECSGNPALDDSLMRAYVHADGRGAKLGSDDRSAIRALYGQGR